MESGKHATEAFGRKKACDRLPTSFVLASLTKRHPCGSANPEASPHVPLIPPRKAASIMRIRYEITVDDLLAFSLHFHQKSPTIRRTRLWSVVGLAAMIIGLCFVASEILGNPIVLWFGVAWAVLFAAIYPQLYRRNVKRYSARLYAEGQNKGIVGQHVAELRDNGLFDGTEFLERTVFWKGIERIETIPGYTFVYLSAMSAHVIPEHSIVEGDYDSFVEELLRRWQAHRE